MVAIASYLSGCDDDVIAMPTLCTGGFRHFRMPASAVAIAALEALRKDFYEHPWDPLRIRVACFDPEHVTIFNAIRDELLEHFFTPDVFWNNLQASI